MSFSGLGLTGGLLPIVGKNPLDFLSGRGAHRPSGPDLGDGHLEGRLGEAGGVDAVDDLACDAGCFVVHVIKIANLNRNATIISQCTKNNSGTVQTRIRKTPAVGIHPIAEFPPTGEVDGCARFFSCVAESAQDVDRERIAEP